MGTEKLEGYITEVKGRDKYGNLILGKTRPMPQEKQQFRSQE